MRESYVLITIVFVFVLAIFIGYEFYDAEKQQWNVGKSVVVNGDTLKIIERAPLNDMYVLENGLVFKYKDYEP